jgi:hypothetical protein
MRPANVAELLFASGRHLSDAEIRRIAEHVHRLRGRTPRTLLTAALTLFGVTGGVVSAGRGGVDVVEVDAKSRTPKKRNPTARKLADLRYHQRITPSKRKAVVTKLRARDHRRDL